MLIEDDLSIFRLAREGFSIFRNLIVLPGRGFEKKKH